MNYLNDLIAIRVVGLVVKEEVEERLIMSGVCFNTVVGLCTKTVIDFRV